MSKFTIDAIDDAIKHATDVARRKYVEGMLYHANSDDGELDDCIKCGREHEQLAEWLEELKCYKDLEDQLEKLYGDRLSLDKVVENLNRVVQNGEEKLDYARILTNAEAEKWDRWKSLEEQGRLIELPCDVGDTVYLISSQYSECSKYQERFNDYNCQGCENECDSHKEYFIHVNENMSAEWIVRAMRLNRFGEDVFLTKEEAEAKLAEMGGEL